MATLSPALNRDTPAPTSTTIPWHHTLLDVSFFKLEGNGSSVVEEGLPRLASAEGENSKIDLEVKWNFIFITAKKKEDI